MTMDDAARVRAAARSVGTWMAIASAVVIAAGVGILLLVLVLSSRAEASHEGIPGRGETDELIVDVDAIVPWVLVLGVVGVALLAFIAWFAARRSVRPLAEALRLQRNFVADASHELRTPLTTLSSRLQILQRRHARGEPIEGTITELRGDVDTMADVLTDLLLSAEGDLDADGASDVRDAVGRAMSAVRPLADDADVSLAVDAADAAAPIFARMPLVTLTRVLVALLDNAIQHAPAGGAVTVSVSASGAAVGSRSSDRARAEIRVSDNGPGIRGIAPDAVFERFARSGERGRRRGFGLGLALVRDAVARHGGTVEVESTTSAGTTFLLRLPLLTER
jgi:signal transduction histidine kinase